MREKKNSLRFTLLFDADLPEHRRAAEFLNACEKHKAFYVAAAINTYLGYPEGIELDLPAGWRKADVSSVPVQKQMTSNDLDILQEQAVDVANTDSLKMISDEHVISNKQGDQSEPVEQDKPYSETNHADIEIYTSDDEKAMEQLDEDAIQKAYLSMEGFY